MLGATPDQAAGRRAMIEALPGRGFAMPKKALFGDRAAVEVGQAQPWSL